MKLNDFPKEIQEEILECLVYEDSGENCKLLDFEHEDVDEYVANRTICFEYQNKWYRVIISMRDEQYQCWSPDEDQLSEVEVEEITEYTKKVITYETIYKNQNQPTC